MRCLVVILQFLPFASGFVGKQFAHHHIFAFLADLGLNVMNWRIRSNIHKGHMLPWLADVHWNQSKMCQCDKVVLGKLFGRFLFQLDQFDAVSLT